MVCNTFRFQFILSSYYGKELARAVELYHLYTEKYPYNPKQEYLYLALIFCAANKNLNVSRLLKGVDKRSRGLFYKEVRLIDALQTDRFKKKDKNVIYTQEPTGASEGFL